MYWIARRQHYSAKSLDMNILVKSFFLVVGVIASALAMFNGNIAAGMVAVGAFISFTLMEIAEFKSKK